MRLLITTICSFFLAISGSYAEVKIKPSYRIENRGYGVCAWASLETSALRAHIITLQGLTDKRDKQSKEKVTRVVPKYGLHGIYLEVVVEERKDNAGTTIRIIQELATKRVTYKLQDENSESRYDTDMLYKGTMDDQPGVIVGIFNYSFTWNADSTELGYLLYQQNQKAEGYHAILVTDITDDYVTYIDSNDVRLPWRMSRELFDRNWDGWAMILTGPIDKETND